MKREVESLGMKATAANPSRLRMVTESNTKNDRNDARELARLALADVEQLGSLNPMDLANPLSSFTRIMRTFTSMSLAFMSRSAY